MARSQYWVTAKVALFNYPPGTHYELTCCIREDFIQFSEKSPHSSHFLLLSHSLLIVIFSILLMYNLHNKIHDIQCTFWWVLTNVMHHPHQDGEHFLQHKGYTHSNLQAISTPSTPHPYKQGSTFHITIRKHCHIYFEKRLTPLKTISTNPFPLHALPSLPHTRPWATKDYCVGFTFYSFFLFFCVL